MIDNISCLPELTIKCTLSIEVLTEFDAHKRDIQILPFIIFTSYDNIKVLPIVWDDLLGDGGDQLAQGLGEALLVSRENVVVQQALAA